MVSPILAIALLSTISLALAKEKRQATDNAQFTSAAEQLISKYIPSTALPAFESRISSAASAANVAGEPLSLIYDALLALSIPGWFESAIPSEWSSQFAALESGVSALRPTSTSGPAIPIVIAITTTNSAGSTFTTSVTSTPSETGTTLTSTETSGLTTTTGTTVPVGGGSVYSSLTTQVIGGVTSVFETAFTGAKSVASVASGGVSTGISGASSVASVASGGISTGISGASSVATQASGVVKSASSVATEASGFLSSATSAAGAGTPTAVSGAAAGVIGIVGLMIAL